MLSSENNAVIGLQWGFEGKKRITDFFANRSETIVRFNGSSSGGHAINAGGEEFMLNYLPCGIHHDGKLCAVTSGTALDLERLSQEILTLKEAGVLKARLIISAKCPLILGFHKKMDMLETRFLGRTQNPDAEDIGWAQALADLELGIGFRTGDLLDKDLLKEKLKNILKLKNAIFTGVYKDKPVSSEEAAAKIIEDARPLLPYIGRTEEYISGAIAENNGILFEGCDGSLSDAAAGRFLNARTALSIFQSAGVRHNCSLRIIGAAKAYSARAMNKGTLITEDKGSVGAFLRTRGSEYNSLTGTARRTGWLDLPALKYSAALNSADMLALTKLDVLTGIDELKVCTAYMLDGKETARGDLTEEESLRARPVYLTIDGWKEDLQGCSDRRHLPHQAQEYIRIIEDYLGLKIIWAGLGREWGNALYDPRGR